MLGSDCRLPHTTEFLRIALGMILKDTVWMCQGLYHLLAIQCSNGKKRDKAPVQALFDELDYIQASGEPNLGTVSNWQCYDLLHLFNYLIKPKEI